MGRGSARPVRKGRWTHGGRIETAIFDPAELLRPFRAFKAFSGQYSANKSTTQHPKKAQGLKAWGKSHYESLISFQHSANNSTNNHYMTKGYCGIWTYLMLKYIRCSAILLPNDNIIWCTPDVCLFLISALYTGWLSFGLSDKFVIYMKLEFIDFTKVVSGSGKYVTYNNESYELCIGYFFLWYIKWTSSVSI